MQDVASAINKGFQISVKNLILLSEVLSSINHIGQRVSDFLPASGLQTTVRVDPELVGWVHLQDLLDSLDKLLLGRNSWRVDVEQSQTDVVRVVGELLDVVGVVLLGELNRHNVGVQGLDVVGVQVGVAEVRVDLGRVLDTGGSDSERLSSPVQVVGSLLTSSQWQAFSDGRLVNLDDSDTSLLQVVDLVSQGQTQLQGLDLLGNIVSWERPSQTGDWASQHTLHGLLGDRLSVDGLLDGHRSWSGNVTNNNWWSDVSRAIRLDPTVLGEGVTLQLLTEVLNHIVSLWLTVDQDVQTNFLLELDNQVDFLLDEVLVLFSGDLALVELVSVDSDVLGLRERTDGGGGEQWQVVLLLLNLQSVWERRLSGRQRLVDGSQSLLNLRVGGDGRLLSGLDGSSVGSEGLGDVFALSRLGQSDNLVQLLSSEREPVLDDRVQLLLVGQVDRSVQQGGRGGDNNSVSTDFLDGLADDSRSLGEVGLPDVSTVNNTNRQGLLVVQDSDNLVELLWDSDKVEVETSDRQVLDGRQVWSDVTEVGGQNNFWQGVVNQGVEGRLVQGLDGLRQVQDQDRLIDLDLRGTSRFQLGQQLLVDWQELGQQVDRVQVQGVLVGLTQVQVGDRTQDNGSGVDAQFLSFQVLVDWLHTVRLVDLELGGVREGWSDIVVVGVEPLDHLQGRDVDGGGGLSGLFLQASAHSEQNVDWGQVVLQVSVGNGVEEQRQVQDLVVEGEIVGGNDLNAGGLLQVPVEVSQLLTLGQQSVSVGLTAPNDLLDGVIAVEQPVPSELPDGLVDVGVLLGDVLFEDLAELGQVGVAQGELGVGLVQKVLDGAAGVQRRVEALAVLQVGAQVLQALEEPVLVRLDHRLVLLDSVVAVVLLVLVGSGAFGTGPANGEQLFSGDVLGRLAGEEPQHLDGVEHSEVEEQKDHQHLDQVEQEEHALGQDAHGVLEVQHELVRKAVLAEVPQRLGHKLAGLVCHADARRGTDKVGEVGVQPHGQQRHERVEGKVVVLPLGHDELARPHVC